MGIQVIWWAPQCTENECFLAENIARIAGVHEQINFDQWRPTKRTSQGIFLLVGAQDCKLDESKLGPWFDEFIKLSHTNAEVRKFPIVVVSPHAERWVRDLYETTGLNLLLEENVQVIGVPHEKAILETPLCASEEVIYETCKTLQRLILTNPWQIGLDPIQVRGNINFRQALSVLQFHAFTLHHEIHQGRNQPELLDEKLGQLARSQLHYARETLTSFIESKELEKLFEAGSDFIDARFADYELISDLATYLVEASYSLKSKINQIRMSASQRVKILIIEDDSKISEKLMAKLNRDKRSSASQVPFPEEEVDSLLEDVRTCGGDGSEIVGEILYRQTVAELEKLGALNSWIRDFTQFVLVVDVRLDPAAPLAGLEIIRRIRDSHPFVKTIALTVRSGLAYQLADEGADAYVLKAADSAKTFESVAEEIETMIWAARKFWCHPEAKKVLDDELLARMLSEKYFLSPASTLNDGDVCLILCADENLGEVPLGNLPSDGVIGILVSSRVTPSDSLRLLTRVKKTWNRKAVILMKTDKPTDGVFLYPSSVAKLDESLHSEIPNRFDTRWTLLVPRSGHFGGLKIETDKKVLSEFRQEIAKRFGGMTADESQGIWVRPNDSVEVLDELERIEVLGRKTESARKYLYGVAESIMTRLGQEEIFLQEERILNWILKPESFPEVPLSVLSKEGRLALEFVPPINSYLKS